jgi:hypothetical protein
MSAGTQFVTTGSVATSTTAKSVLSVIAGSVSSPAIIGFDFSSDGTVTTGQFLVELVRFTTDGTGTSATPFKLGGSSTVVSTSKSNYTVEPTTATVVASYWIPAAQLYGYVFPLGREISLGVSGLITVRVTAPSGTPNVRCNIWFEE